MEQLPKIVQRGLHGTPKPGVHPDPDLLTAFAEKSLNDRERSQVLHHLAECVDCRVVIALAMPEIQPTRSPVEERSSWLSWPLLRWGALAACVVVVGAAVTLHYDRRQTRESSVAEKIPAAPAPLAGNNPDNEVAAKIVPSPPQSDRDSGAAGNPAKQSEETRASSAANPALIGKLKTEQRGSPRLEDMPFVGGYEGDRLMSKRSARADQVQSADKAPMFAGEPSVVVGPSPPNAKMADVRPQIKDWNKNLDSAVKVGGETENVEAEAAQIATAQSAPENAKAGAQNESRKKVQIAGVAEMKPLQTPGRSVSSLGGANRIVPSWTLSPRGQLQRSIDSGKTWQMIPMVSNVVFRALAANDSDIWVGGAAGALYHSSDAGQHWLQVKPAANGKILTADIVAIEFDDAQDGKVTTANRETWTTSDAGNSWQSH